MFTTMLRPLCSMILASHQVPSRSLASDPTHDLCASIVRHVIWGYRVFVLCRLSTRQNSIFACYNGGSSLPSCRVAGSEYQRLS
ncbi:hypothetical protein F4779DRAFT_605002 [Xylariaceae sp. FL0662B]|nr:hypothetical protein F4779DRAFT_605002 [Xylariaceae sp. FL0662B]